jgi:hypothetical protein
MAQILLGQFDDFQSAEAVAGELRSVGVAPGDIEIFHLNAPGQHDRYPVGGDENADRNARQGDEGQLAGAAMGAAAGLALGAMAIPVAGPLAAAAGMAVGAHTGSLHGAVSALGDNPGATTPLRPAGVRVGVHIVSPSHREHVLAALRRHDVRSIEEGDGTWSDGSWSDFYPVSTPRWVEPPKR